MKLSEYINFLLEMQKDFQSCVPPLDPSIMQILVNDGKAFGLRSIDGIMSGTKADLAGQLGSQQPIPDDWRDERIVLVL